jgi:hypothetical protein
MASSIIFLRKDAQIGEINRQYAKRATSASHLAGLLQGVAPVALTDLRRSFRTIQNLAGWRRSRFLRPLIDYTAAVYSPSLTRSVSGDW